MSNWYYYSNNQKYGPVSSAQLQKLVLTSVIQFQTVVETENGRKFYARDVKGLFQEPTSETETTDTLLPANSAEPTPEKETRYWIVPSGTLNEIGPLRERQLRYHIRSGEIQETDWLFLNKVPKIDLKKSAAQNGASLVGNAYPDFYDLAPSGLSKKAIRDIGTSVAWKIIVFQIIIGVLLGLFIALFFQK